jgi:pimeloyl-ACP methyl ester carboxylesterase
VTEATNEQFADVGRGIRLCFEEMGEASAPPLLLIAGLGQQLISWPRPLCELLAHRGFRVIRFDNRDSGRSTHMRTRPAGPMAMMTGRFPPGTYNLGDMALDTRGLLEALDIQGAHLVGASMGGMIAQVMASRYPARVRSLTSMFSTTGAPKIGRPALSTWLMMAARPPRTVDEAIKADLRTYRHIGSHGFELDTSWISRHAAAAWERDPTTDGVSRQLAAILASGDRTEELTSVVAPTLVIHGDRDRMVATSGARATHRAIPSSTLWIVPGMGHDYPQALWPELVERVGTHAGGAEPRVPATPSGPARPRKRQAPAAVATPTSTIPKETHENAAS